MKSLLEDRCVDLEDQVRWLRGRVWQLDRERTELQRQLDVLADWVADIAADVAWLRGAS
jgi:hypothetical protein